MVELTRELLASLQPAKQFTDNVGGPSGSLDFDATGEFCVTTCPADDSILLYNCLEGECRKVIHSKKYGAGLARFAHRSTTVIYTSTKGEDDAIRYLSLHDNRYLRYFRGHTRRVTQLELSPLNDAFLSVAPDEALCLWDLRTAHVQGRLSLAPNSAALATFDPQGLVFAVATGSRFIRLYDARHWDRGPFAAFDLTPPPGLDAIWTALQFSPDGRTILVSVRVAVGDSTSTSTSTPAPVAVGYIVDSFDGTVRCVLERPGPRLSADRLSYTPDSCFVLGGRSDGIVSVWSARCDDAPQRDNVALPVIDAIDSPDRDPIHTVAFNPQLAMLVTTGRTTCFYI